MRLKLTLAALSFTTAAIAACVGDSTVPPTDGGSDGTTSDVSTADGGCGDATDPNNCGSCGHACATGFSCNGGVCGNAVAVLGAGANHTCVGLVSGDVYCWGADLVGQAGKAPTANIPPTHIPRDIASNTFTGIAFSGGLDHLCAVRTNNQASCWGNNEFGELGVFPTSQDGGPVIDPTPGNPVKTFGLSPPLSFSTLAHGPTAIHTCGVDDGGVVYCWGDDSAFEASFLDAATPQPCNGGTSTCLAVPTRAISELAVQVAVGNGFTCSLDGAGAVRCWGAHSEGQLANGKYGGCFGSGCNTLSVVSLSGPASYIATGDTNACAIIASDGSVVCWGNNESDQLGYPPIGSDGGAADPCCSIDCGFSGGHPRCEPHPIVVSGVTNAIAVAIGVAHVCVLEKTGSVLCWGANDKGQLGGGSSNTTPSPTPTKVSNLTNVTQIVSGASHSCALEKDGSVWCWGLNSNGQLGLGTSNATAPIQVTTLP